MSELQAIASLLAIYGGLWLANTILGIRNSLSKGYKFDKAVFWDGVIRAVLGAFALTVGAVALLAIPRAFEAVGISVGADTQKAISLLAIVGAIGAGIIVYAGKFVKAVQELFNPENELKPEMEIKPSEDNWNEGEIVLGVGDLPADRGTKEPELSEATIREVVAKYLEEQPDASVLVDPLIDSGQGLVVTTKSPDAFRNAVIGRGYDIDGYYGWQCWDGMALFWMSAVGRTFSTGGTGAARGAWEAARKANAGTEFELITDRKKIKKGDVLVFGGTKWGHTGMAMSGYINGNYVKLLGENQGVGAAGKNGGYAFSEINMSLSNFLGAFRLKKWHASPAPAKPKPATNTYKVVKSIKGYYSAADARKRKSAKVTVKAATYYVFNKAEGMINVTTKKGVPGSWINPGDNKKAAPAKKPAPKKPAGFKVGQTVRVKKAVDTAGRKLTISGTYKISELKGSRAVITKGGVVVAAISTKNLSHA